MFSLYGLSKFEAYLYNRYNINYHDNFCFTQLLCLGERLRFKSMMNDVDMFLSAAKLVLKIIMNWIPCFSIKLQHYSEARANH